MPTVAADSFAGLASDQAASGYASRNENCVNKNVPAIGFYGARDVFAWMSPEEQDSVV